MTGHAASVAQLLPDHTLPSETEHSYLLSTRVGEMMFLFHQGAFRVTRKFTGREAAPDDVIHLGDRVWYPNPPARQIPLSVSHANPRSADQQLEHGFQLNFYTKKSAPALSKASADFP